jgi:thymidylate kinase
MKNQTHKYLAYIGFQQDLASSGGLKLYAINNPDGSVRWLWNAKNQKPDFLRFYAASSIRSLVFIVTIKLVFFLRLQHFFFRKSALVVGSDEKHRLAPLVMHDFALFTGTEGPNRKLVLYANNEFVKIAISEKSRGLIENESCHLKTIKNGEFFEIPTIKIIDKGIVGLSDLGKMGKRQQHFSALHAQALLEVYNQSATVHEKLQNTSVFAACTQYVHAKYAHKMPSHLIEKLQSIERMLADEPFIFNWAHRDFTPWNCFVGENKIHLYDFEMAHAQLPFAFDAFHFVLQQGILVDRLAWKNILPKLKKAFDLMAPTVGLETDTFNKYLKAYLYINTAYHLDLYSQQNNWHEQIHWLFNTWNDALSDVLQDQAPNRVLLIADVFDFLRNEFYAAIKYPNSHPKDLDELSDVDLLTTKKTTKALLKYLRSHSLVARVKVKTQAHMVQVMVVLKSGELLALDLLWQFKRKSLVFMDVQTCLQQAVFNDFGIKTLSPTHTREYLKNFYGLNGSPIPEKYHAYFEDGEQITHNPKELFLLAKAMPVNKGFSGVVHNIGYVVDVLRSFFNDRGVIVTFSGVDGAGKSTIIEKTKHIVEKKMRKKVVVIRHRPSLLPILSAITQGKEKAELKAANTLPRQGQNKSLVGSLLRFGYYYVDYLIGQFYIYAKYIMRGEVVLYDRYYFDFINDGLRSNIRLPKWITKAGYTFLMAPHLNFFLYADAQIILSRKKELDEKAITELTKDYLNLFSELDAKVANSYFPVENIQLETSLQFISNKVQSKIY